MGTIIDRLQYFMQNEGINNNQLTIAAGLSVGLIGRAIKNKSGLNSDSIEKILYAYSNLNPNWLLTGRGDMLINKDIDKNNGNLNGNLNSNLSAKNINIDQILAKTKHVEIKFPNPLDNEEETCVPFYDLPVSAGSLGVLDSDGSEVPVPKGYVQLSVFRGCEYIFPVIGISMEPLIYSGDWIGIRHIDNISRSWDFIQTGVIYLIITHEDRMIKFIEQSSDSDDYIVCSSPNYKSFKVYKGDIINIYRVKAFARGI